MAEAEEKQAFDFAHILARLSDSDKRLASTEQAIRESNERLRANRVEEEETKARTEKMNAESVQMRKDASATVEKAAKDAAALKEQGKHEYDVILEQAHAAAREAMAAVQGRINELEVQFGEKRREIAMIDAEVTEKRGLQAEIRREMIHLRARLE